MIFSYRGKGSIMQRQVVVDRRLARLVARLERTPGTRLFRYLAKGRWHDLTARELNEYIHSLAKSRDTAKDFRTWGGTLRMATVLGDLGPAASPAESKRNVALAVRLVAAELGNTPAICRASYVHPLVIARYIDGGVTIAIGDAASTGDDEMTSGALVGGARPASAHTPEERALLTFLDRYFPERRREEKPAPRRERRDTRAAA
jgi:DNA topoisomerase-1